MRLHPDPVSEYDGTVPGIEHRTRSPIHVLSGDHGMGSDSEDSRWRCRVRSIRVGCDPGCVSAHEVPGGTKHLAPELNLSRRAGRFATRGEVRFGRNPVWVREEPPDVVAVARE